MGCCGWQRSENDALQDSEMGKMYCGTCWQKWIASQATVSSHLSENRLEREPSDEGALDVGPVIVADDESVGELEGVQHGNELFVMSRAKGLVFSAEREADGRLRCVGKMEPAGGKGGAITWFEGKTKQADGESKELPFLTDADDHCETPLDAYQDLAPYLRFLARAIGKDAATLEIWDPFYCDGGVKQKLGRLGFGSVHNECVDFYKVVESGKLPPHDCIVTNPPYSSEPVDHVHRLVKILCAQLKPWFVVQPNYVYVKPYWEEVTCSILAAPRPFFLTPKTPRKYKYKTPPGMRLVSSQQLKTSPFVSMWYCWLGPKYTEQLYRWISKRKGCEQLPLTLSCTEYFLPDSFKDSNDKTRRKVRKPKKRKAEGEMIREDSQQRKYKNKKKHKKKETEGS